MRKNKILILHLVQRKAEINVLKMNILIIKQNHHKFMNKRIPMSIEIQMIEIINNFPIYLIRLIFSFFIIIQIEILYTK